MKALDDFKKRSLRFSKALSTIDFPTFEKTGELFVLPKRESNSLSPRK